MAKEQAKRPHIYELDPLRVCTALGVVAVHVLFFTRHLNASAIGFQIQNALVVTFHFTREVFVFVTAFALVYVYGGRKLPLLQFWKKRGLGVLLPYVIWSIIYVWVNTPHQSPGIFLQNVAIGILTGNSSYQMYYILLTLQFYIILPFFLPFIRRCARHPWITLAISLALQILLYGIDYPTIQASHAPFWQAVTAFQECFFPVYQFYLILGGLTAIYFPQVRAFVLRHGRLGISMLLLALGALWLNFALQVNIAGADIDYASSVLQPIMIPYSIAVIFFALWLASKWTNKTSQQQPQRPRGYRFWHTLSDAAFGVYLVHALILTVLLTWMVPALPASWPEPARVLLTWCLTAGGSLGICILLLNIPIASRLVGRAGPQRKKPVEPRPRADHEVVTLGRTGENHSEAKSA